MPVSGFRRHVPRNIFHGLRGVMAYAAVGLFCLAFLFSIGPQTYAIAQEAAQTAPVSGERSQGQPPPGADTQATDFEAEHAQPVPEPETGQPPAAAPAFDNITALASRVEGLRVRLGQAESAFSRAGLTDADMLRIEAELTEIAAETRALVAEIEPIVSNAEARLAELGPAPEDGEPAEPETIAAERVQLSAALAEREAVLRNTRLLTVRADQLAGQMQQLRRDQFTERLSERTSSILSPLLWHEALADLPAFFRGLGLLLNDTVAALPGRVQGADVIVLVIGVFAIAAVTVLLRRAIAGFALRDPDIDEPDISQKAVKIAWMFAANAIIPTAALVGFAFLTGILDVFNPRFETLLYSLIVGVGVILTFTALSTGFLAPAQPNWRIGKFSDRYARGGATAIRFIAVVLAADIFLAGAGDVLLMPVASEIAVSGSVAMLVGIGVLVALQRISAGRREAEEEDGQAPVPAPSADLGFVRWPWIRIILWFTAVIVILATLAGFVALASFLARQLAGFSLIMALLWLLVRLSDYAFTVGLKTGTPANRSLSISTGFSPPALERFGIVLSGLSQLVLILLAVVLIATPWGFSTVDWVGFINRNFAGFQVGEIRISPARFLAAVGVVVIFLLLFRVFRNWLEKRYLPSTNFDPGLQNSIATIIGYIGVIVAAIIGFDYIGLDVENLALVAGALSVGIGFGLQSIVSNFVSGIILLAERPIRAGDWIIAGDYEGTVRKISVRSTEIETFDRASVIVPNSDLITGTVKNYTHLNTIGRVIINVGVGYDSDPEQVRDLLLNTARENSGVLAYPEPRVFFQDFGASSLDFSLYAFLVDVNSTLTVRSDLRFAILKALREADIEIPFPQRHLTLSWDEAKAAAHRFGEEERSAS